MAMLELYLTPEGKVVKPAENDSVVVSLLTPQIVALQVLPGPSAESGIPLVADTNFADNIALVCGLLNAMNWDN